MTGPEVRCFPLADGNGRVRAEWCAVRGVSLLWEGCDDMMLVGPHYFPVGLVGALGPQFAELVVWCAEHGCSVATDVRADQDRALRLLRQAEAREFKDVEEW